MTKRRKGIKGEPAIYEEFKERVNISLTPTAIASLDKAAQKRGISRSELIEQYARSLIEEECVNYP
jgi:metal-responsive CopG/Arc/MetJ family transcriptional regulator